jgi:hypothetical protein
MLGHTMSSKACPLRFKKLSQPVLAPEEASEGTPASPEALTEAPKEAPAEVLRYDDPRAIYQRYITARAAWYQSQPRGNLRTNQLYRKALGLPLRYDKASYKWCLDYKQMGRQCNLPEGFRDWTKEEMMAYLDWSKAEDDRVEAQIVVEMEGNPFSSRKGMGGIWRAAEKDIEEQQALYSAD